MKNIFVSGTSGAQGQAIATVLNREGYTVTGMSRSETSNDLNLKLKQGDLEKLVDVSSAMEGCDAVILTLPLLFDATLVKTITQNIVSAAKLNSISTIVFNSGIPLGDNKTGFAAIDVKHDALEILDLSGLNIVTLMPTIYLDNLNSPFLRPIIDEHSIIPYPLAMDFEFSWISQENLGRFCLAALSDNKLHGKRIVISNRDKLSGNKLANAISIVSKRKFTYVPSSFDEFENNLKPVLGDFVAKEIANLYRGIDQHRADFFNEENQHLMSHVELQTTSDWAKEAKF
ncbi:SDR family oxidoreductase [Alginatibacterium sediminis]|nr:NAD(P)H-binding protein [Alginatibacterium sediminis]